MSPSHKKEPSQKVGRAKNWSGKKGKSCDATLFKDAEEKRDMKVGSGEKDKQKGLLFVIAAAYIYSI